MTTGTIQSIVANLVTVAADGPVAQNEICTIMSPGANLRAEVIKVRGHTASAQVFESTRSIRVGMKVEFTGRPLTVDLGPGILSKNYDGLQNDLEKMGGVFLKDGEVTAALDHDVFYPFTPLVKPGDKVQAGDWLGNAKENWIDHKIMVPFSFPGTHTVTSVSPAGDFTINHTIAELKDEEGRIHAVTMVQQWPVKQAVRAYREKLRPFTLLKTGLRVFDTFTPLAEGGTGYIPGAFGTGKTVLQQSIAKYCDADIIILVACGERANEVVEIFTEFAELSDPRTGRKLKERTTIVCNTSNMPVAAREISVYVGMTMAEYYRSMGLKVLLQADSTSRWAQALREMSNRLEELPGPDAFPVDLSATIANFYSRAGYVILNNGESGSLSFLGTVSPAGGNFKEPVTESTKKVARCYYALSQQRADAKRYPAIDPQSSYSKYLEYPEFRKYAEAEIHADWIAMIGEARDRMKMGLEARDQISILGDDAVPLDYHVQFWRSELIDFVLIQQDSFDEVDANAPLERQKMMLTKVLEVCRTEFAFTEFEQISDYFKRIINQMKQMNYVAYPSRDYDQYDDALQKLLTEFKPDNAVADEA